MCFYSNTRKLKIAKRPIKVYKWLRKDNIAPYNYYLYKLGINFPRSSRYFIPCEDNLFIFGYGVLHSYKTPPSEGHIGYLIPMYIPKGTKYNDQGVKSGLLIGGNGYLFDSTNEIISEALYWPKNKFEEWWYNLISKKY